MRAARRATVPDGANTVLEGAAPGLLSALPSGPWRRPGAWPASTPWSV